MHADFENIETFELGIAAERLLPEPRRRTARLLLIRDVERSPVLPLEDVMARPVSTTRRAIDIVVASVGLVMLSPLFFLIALAVRLTSPGPVFYAQERTGLGMRRFKMYKFRTMVAGAESLVPELGGLNEMSGPLVKIRCDPRLTRIGPFLRRTSLDELPQLLNVLRGDMTLIGPRALSPHPSKYEPWQRRRFTVTPGLACTWQARRRADRDFEAWMRTDLRYIDEATAWTNICLAFRILIRVLSCNGAC